MAASERRRGREHERQPLVAPRQFHAQRRAGGAVETDAETVVALQTGEVEIRLVRGDLAGVKEKRRVDKAIDHDAPLGLEQQAVAIAEAPGRKAAQRVAVAERRQHEEGNLLAVARIGGAGAAVQREHPGFASDRNVLNRLVVDLLKTEEMV